MYSAKRKFGNIGENVAVMFLEKRGFKVLERNYLRKWGEIDIVAEKSDVLRFIEVKSVSGEINNREVTPETGYRPEENMHPGKIKRLHRAIQTYLLEKHLDKDWQLDLITVRIDEKNRKAKAEMLENII
ncbi:YraN family protein [Candidatus Parcubacteria bacterium]|nr:YraN family protein [Candidatus Parcubacteria bacterium]